MTHPADCDGEARARLRDGAAVRLRPIAADDGERLRDLLDRMSPEDVRHRFFAPVREFSEELARHLLHPDPAREIALVAVTPDGAGILGVARFAADETGRSAEFALVVRTDMKGRGLGHLLFGRLLDAARARGIAEIWGDIMRDNEAMLQMARKQGFAVARHPAEPGLLRATKRLGDTR